jgi:hypothetical protein
MRWFNKSSYSSAHGLSFNAASCEHRSDVKPTQGKNHDAWINSCGGRERPKRKSSNKFGLPAREQLATNLTAAEHDKFKIC